MSGVAVLLTKRDGRSDLDIVEVIVDVAAEAAVAAVDIIRLRKDMVILFLSLQETVITVSKGDDYSSL